MIERWLKEAIHAAKNEESLPSLSPVIRELGAIGTVSALLEEELIDNRLYVEILAIEAETVIQIRVFGGGRYGYTLLRIQIPWGDLMRKIWEAA